MKRDEVMEESNYVFPTVALFPTDDPSLIHKTQLVPSFESVSTFSPFHHLKLKLNQELQQKQQHRENIYRRTAVVAATYCTDVVGESEIKCQQMSRITLNFNIFFLHLFVNMQNA